MNDAGAELQDIYIYPVKSLRGCAVSSAVLDDLGIVGDRRLLVVDADGRFMTQRTLPRMALITPTLGPETLTLAAEGAASVNIHRASDPAAAIREVSIWSSNGLQAEDCGDAAATWLSDFLHTPCRLVRAGLAFHRPLVRPGKAHPGDVVSFPDAFPLLAIGAATLVDLNDRLVETGADPVPMNRFRPNLVIAGSPAYAEDTWHGFSVGTAHFRAGGPCARCIVTTTDQETGERGTEPLRLLSTYRRDPADPTHVLFGQNLIHEPKSGAFQVGDRLRID